MSEHRQDFERDLETIEARIIELFAMVALTAPRTWRMVRPLVYAMRGFAAAVWTHALYDLWVLVL